MTTAAYSSGCYYCGENCHDEAALLRKHVAVLLQGFELGVFHRNVAGDGRSDWAVNFLPYALALGKLSELVPPLVVGQKDVARIAEAK
jgi:hypothetical protein